MDRRALLGAIALGLLAAPLASHARPASPAAPTAIVRVGWLAPDAKPFALDAFREALKDLGWVEGRNLTIEERYTHGLQERYAELAAELVQLKVDVLVTDGSPATTAAQAATATIPIVFVVGDPVAGGFVASLSHPGGTLTGVTIITGDLNPKRIQLLKEAVPAMARLAIVEDRSATGLATSGARLAGNWQAIEAASRQLGIQLTRAREVRRGDQLEDAFALAVRERAGGVLVLPSAFFASQITRIVGLAAKARLPAMYEHRDFVAAGGLMSYGPSHRDMFRRVAAHVDRILKGAKPADLPVEQPTKLELAVNLRTARALGLTIPPSVLGRADELIQ